MDWSCPWFLGVVDSAEWPHRQCRPWSQSRAGEQRWPTDDSNGSASASALDGTRGEAGDVVLHEERVDERDRHRAEERARHQLAPVEGVAANQLSHHADRHGAYVGAAPERE